MAGSAGPLTAGRPVRKRSSGAAKGRLRCLSAPENRRPSRDARTMRTNGFIGAPLDHTDLASAGWECVRIGRVDFWTSAQGALR
jgi:hypothetical protein